MVNNNQYLNKIPGSGKKLDSKKQKGKTHKTLRDFSCVSASTSKGTNERILPLNDLNIPFKKFFHFFCFLLTE